MKSKPSTPDRFWAFLQGRAVCTVAFLLTPPPSRGGSWWWSCVGTVHQEPAAQLKEEAAL